MSDEPEYNWKLILAASIPLVIAVVFIFRGVASGWAWVWLILCMVAASTIVYFRSKKKADIFTAAAIIFLVGVGLRFLERAGIL